MANKTQIPIEAIAGAAGKDDKGILVFSQTVIGENWKEGKISTSKNTSIVMPKYADRRIRSDELEVGVIIKVEDDKSMEK